MQNIDFVALRICNSCSNQKRNIDYKWNTTLIEPGVIKTNFVNNMKIGKNVITSSISNNDNSPYVEIIQKRISAFKPKFEKGSTASEVVDMVLEAVTSANPKARYLVGEDALKMMEKRKNTAEEEFARLVMNSVLGRGFP